MILNAQIWNGVIAAARAKTVARAANPQAWQRAIDRAVAEIEKSPYWAFADGVLTIKSTSSGKLYRIDDAHTCEARNGICKHRAARRLMVLYFEALEAEPLAPHEPERAALARSISRAGAHC